MLWPSFIIRRIGNSFAAARAKPLLVECKHGVRFLLHLIYRHLHFLMNYTLVLFLLFDVLLRAIQDRSIAWEEETKITKKLTKFREKPWALQAMCRTSYVHQGGCCTLLWLKSVTQLYLDINQSGCAFTWVLRHTIQSASRTIKAFLLIISHVLRHTGVFSFLKHCPAAPQCPSMSSLSLCLLIPQLHPVLLQRQLERRLASQGWWW